MPFNNLHPCSKQFLVIIILLKASKHKCLIFQCEEYSIPISKPAYFSYCSLHGKKLQQSVTES